MSEEIKAAYLGSFRGITYGHIDVIEKLAEIFDEVIVGIGINPDKSPEFSLAELETNAQHALRHLPNVRVMSFSGLFTDFLDEQEVDVLVRGMRSGQEYEAQIVQELYDRWDQDRQKKQATESALKDLVEQLERQKKRQRPALNENQTVFNYQSLKENSKPQEPATLKEKQRITFYFPSTPGKDFISSSLVKNVLKESGDATGLAPSSTIAELTARLGHKYPYGITGVSGAGKTTICRAFNKIAAELCIPLHHEDMDKIAHDILSEREESTYVTLRKNVAEIFGPMVVNPGASLWNDDGYSINRSELGQILFGNPEAMAIYNKMMSPHILRRLRKNLQSSVASGVILIDSALLPEANLTHLANHNVMVVDADLETRIGRLKRRQNLSPEQVRRRAESQYTTEKKIEHILDAIVEADYGSLQVFANNEGTPEKDIRNAFLTMLEQIDVFGELRIKGFFKRNGVPNANAAYETVRTLYGENTRRYHALSHVVDGLNHLQKIEDRIENPKAFILGWIFHDAVYNTVMEKNPDRPTNEERSAALMARTAAEWGFDRETIEQAKNLILHTQIYKMTPQTNDEKLFVDLDMSILGREPEEFARYERNLRIEHGNYTETAWLKGRIAFLQSLDADNLYRTDYFEEKYGAQAKTNIETSLTDLSRKEAKIAAQCNRQKAASTPKP
ncbi:MAG: dephospho-CoA kinase [Alphaproteobacteria bacterium]|nr:dephospho-CoA kinase [Alphaproteobacteria bacterium]